MKWFRLYTDVLHDPKVQRLHPSAFKNWINVLCIANQNRERGILPPVEDVAFALRVKPTEAEKILAHLEDRRLLNRDEHGRLFPHNWTERQRNSDVGATRQQRYREKKKRDNGEITKKVTLLSRDGDALEVDKEEKNPSFLTFWNVYPRKVAKGQARKVWEKLNPDSTLQSQILKALEWQQQQPDWSKDGGKFIPHPATWLNGRRWEDEQLHGSGQGDGIGHYR